MISRFILSPFETAVVPKDWPDSVKKSMRGWDLQSQFQKHSAWKAFNWCSRLTTCWTTTSVFVCFLCKMNCNYVQSNSCCFDSKTTKTTSFCGNLLFLVFNKSLENSIAFQFRSFTVLKQAASDATFSISGSFIYFCRYNSLMPKRWNVLDSAQTSRFVLNPARFWLTDRNRYK